MKLKTLAAVVLIAAVALGASIAYAFRGGTLINASYAVTQVLPINLGSGVSQLGVTVAYSSPTLAAVTFTTGQISTATITIVSNTQLSTAAATESIVITSTVGALGDFVSMSCPIPPGAVVARVNRDWIYGPTVSSAATNLMLALRKQGAACLGGVVFSTAPGGVVYATAPVGGLYNGISVVTNAADTITVSSPTFLGGRNSAIVSVNGVNLTANLTYNVGTSSNASAANLATAINTKVGALVTATNVAGDNHISLVSDAAGKAYALASSNAAAATVSASTMYGALTPSWTLGTKNITIASHGLVTGLPVIYSTGSAAAITGLVNQTTYYIGVVDANTVALASSRVNAAAGTYITLASSSTLAAAKTYTLTPLAFSAGSAGFAWTVSNSTSGPWVPLSVDSVTYTSPGSSVWSFGALPFHYLGLSFTAPTQGAITLQATAQGQ